MLRRLFRDEPELLALALIVLVLAAGSVDGPGFPFNSRHGALRRPEVRVVIPELPPPMNPIERIRF